MNYSLKNYLILNLFDNILSYSKKIIQTSFSIRLIPFLPTIKWDNKIFLFLKTNKLYTIYNSLCKSFMKNQQSTFSTNVNLQKRFKFLTFVGLGFKKRLRKIKKHIYLFFGHRHWTVFQVPVNFNIYFMKRKGMIMYSKTKHLMSNIMLSFKNFKKESIFKLKGLFDMRTYRRWLFMRRIKVRGMRPKLSKKQKLL